MSDGPEQLQISAPGSELDTAAREKLSANLQECGDLAFAYLARTLVADRQTEPSLVLFAWLQPAALRSIRQALNLVSDAVGRALPKGAFLDVVILNSAPEILEPLQNRGVLVNQRDPEEHARALQAACEETPQPLPPARPSWWPFG